VWTRPAVDQSVAAEAADRLRGFRGELLTCVGRRADELFELTDALLCAVDGRLTAAGHWRAGDPPIMVMLDAGYDVTRLAFVLADLPVHLWGGSAPTA
jgi:hypothetical protein